MKKFLNKKVYLNVWQTTLVAAVFVLLVTVLSFAMMPGEAGFADGVGFAWKQICEQPLLAVMNILPPLLLMLLLFAILNNVFFAGAILFLSVTLLSYGNYLKTVMRSDPLTPQDVMLLREALFAVKDFDISINGPLLVLLIVFTLIFALAGLIVKNRKKTLLRRVVFIVVALVLCVGAEEAMYNADHYSARYIYYHKLTRTDDANHAQNYKEMGFLYSFLYNRNAYGFTKPEGFSKAEAEGWENEDAGGSVSGGDVGNEGNSGNGTGSVGKGTNVGGNGTAEGTGTGSERASGVKPHVVMVMCEAFCDITNNEVFLYDEENDPLRNYNVLSASEGAISGHIVVPNVNAGTANTEFDVMTGGQTKQLADGSIPFFSIRKETTGIASVLSDEGYASMFTHPGRSWYYNRQNVYDYFGFDELYFADAYKNAEYSGTLVKDDSVGDFIIDAFESQTSESSDPFFSFAVTIENHMPYTVDRYGRDSSRAPDPVPLAQAIPAESAQTLAIYIEGLRSGDRLLGRLADYFGQTEEPVILVFFGDHLPSLGENFAVYRELGLSVGSTATYEETLTSYETPYIIWANEAALAQTDFAETAAVEGLKAGSAGEDTNTMSANYLGALVLELAGFGDDDAYFSFLNETRKQMPVLWGDIAVVNAVSGNQNGVSAGIADGGSAGIMADGTAESSDETTDRMIKSLSELTEEQRETVRKMVCWGYYRMKYI